MPTSWIGCNSFVLNKSWCLSYVPISQRPYTSHQIFTARTVDFARTWHSYTSYVRPVAFHLMHDFLAFGSDWSIFPFTPLLSQIMPCISDALLSFGIWGPFCELGSYSIYASVDAVVFLFGLKSHLARLWEQGIRRLQSSDSGSRCPGILWFWRMTLVKAKPLDPKLFPFSMKVSSIVFLLETAGVLRNINKVSLLSRIVWRLRIIHCSSRWWRKSRCHYIDKWYICLNPGSQTGH